MAASLEALRECIGLGKIIHAAAPGGHSKYPPCSPLHEYGELPYLEAHLCNGQAVFANDEIEGSGTGSHIHLSPRWEPLFF